MSDPALGLLMLGLIVVVIMMGFPTAFTLMGLGMFFGFFAYHRAGHAPVFRQTMQRTISAEPCSITNAPANGIMALK